MYLPWHRFCSSEDKITDYVYPLFKDLLCFYSTSKIMLKTNLGSSSWLKYSYKRIITCPEDKRKAFPLHRSTFFFCWHPYKIKAGSRSCHFPRFLPDSFL